ncbi:unnamed protein product [Periconia digitata]|uniref:Rhodopsin domain-containing protein n=1 Tax=Periconia digitata TaxID=1303443 RepID=A0A9W4XYW7_9PLEO|nr:unnamed protein product [Periconia digitata]
MSTSDALPPDENRGPTLNIVCWLGVAISTTFALLRLYSRKYVTHTLNWSDAIIGVAVLLHITSVSLSSVAISYGTGRHLAHIPPENITPTLFYTIILQPIGITAFLLPKWSVAMLIVSLMGVEKKGAWLLWTTIIILFATNVLSFIMTFAQCNPPNVAWHPERIEEADCLPPHVTVYISYVGGSWSAFTDFILAVFPAFLLRNVQIKRSKKIKAVIIMGFGVFATIAAVIKTTQLSQAASQDFPYDMFWLVLTAFIETDFVIIAACTPMLPGLIKKWRGQTATRKSYGYSGGTIGSGGRRFMIDPDNADSVALTSMTTSHAVDNNNRAPSPML